MARAARVRRPLLAAFGTVLIALLSVTGCVSLPTGGPVQSYPVTQQGADAQTQPYVQVKPPSPRPGWTPQQVVQGFLIASASFGAYSSVAKEYLAPSVRNLWKPDWSAIVYKSGPNVTAPVYPPDAKSPSSATVRITGTVQASLKGSGSYSVPRASSQGAVPSMPEPSFDLEKVNGQWRISSAPTELLLTSNSFQNDFQLSNLYFFDPVYHYLVPDPIYLPLAATQPELLNGLVRDLITPPVDWLSKGAPGTAGATKTAFPAGTKLVNVNLDGVTAVVNLAGAAITKANSTTMLRISAQLLSTLRNAAQGSPNQQTVQSVEVLRNGNPWYPPKSQNNPVQQNPTYRPALGQSDRFYYIDRAGYLYSHPSGGGSPTRLAKIGTKFTQLAVSPDGKYVAAVRGDALYAGPVNGALASQGGGFVSVSWDSSDNLWASQGSQVVMFHAAQAAGEPLGEPVPVLVQSDAFLNTPYSLIKVAPDGVRVAMVLNGGTLSFGAISGQNGPNPQIWLSTVQDTPITPVQSSPAIASFTSLTWYGPDDVITLATPGPAVTMYPVSGGSTTSIPTDSDMETISASYKQPFVAGLSNGQMATDASLTGSWMSINVGNAPVKGISPVYPG